MELLNICEGKNFSHKNELFHLRISRRNPNCGSLFMTHHLGKKFHLHLKIKFFLRLLFFTAWYVTDILLLHFLATSGKKWENIFTARLVFHHASSSTLFRQKFSREYNNTNFLWHTTQNSPLKTIRCLLMMKKL